MIGKQIKGKSFRGLARYLARDSARIAWTGGYNIIMEDPIEVVREMEDVAAVKERCETERCVRYSRTKRCRSHRNSLTLIASCTT